MEDLEVLYLAASSPFGIIVKAGANPRLLYSRLWKARRQHIDPQLENLQIKAAGSAFPEGDFIIYKKIA